MYDQKKTIVVDTPVRLWIYIYGVGMVGAFASDGMAAEVILDMFEADGIGMVGAFASDGMAAELLLVAMASWRPV